MFNSVRYNPGYCPGGLLSIPEEEEVPSNAIDALSMKVRRSLEEYLVDRNFKSIMPTYGYNFSSVHKFLQDELDRYPSLFSMQSHNILEQKDELKTVAEKWTKFEKDLGLKVGGLINKIVCFEAFRESEPQELDRYLVLFTQDRTGIKPLKWKVSEELLDVEMELANQNRSSQNSIRLKVKILFETKTYLQYMAKALDLIEQMHTQVIEHLQNLKN